MTDLRKQLEAWAERYNDDTGMYEGFIDAIRLVLPVIEAAERVELYTSNGKTSVSGADKVLLAMLELKSKLEVGEE